MDIKIAELFYNTDLDIGYMKNVNKDIKGSSFIIGCTKCNKLSGFKFDAEKVGIFGGLKIYMVCKICENKEELIIR